MSLSKNNDLEAARDAEINGQPVMEINQDGHPEKTYAPIVEEQEERNLSRSLKQRHIQLIALAGVIVSYSFSSLNHTG